MFSYNISSIILKNIIIIIFTPLPPIYIILVNSSFFLYIIYFKELGWLHCTVVLKSTNGQLLLNSLTMSYISQRNDTIYKFHFKQCHIKNIYEHNYYILKKHFVSLDEKFHNFSQNMIINRV